MPLKVWTDETLAEVVLRLQAGASHAEVAEEYGINANTLACRVKRYRNRVGIDPDETPPAPDPMIDGETADYREADPAEVWAELERKSLARARRKREQPPRRLAFEHGPVSLVFLGDLHIGGSGVDYALAREHAEIIADTPGMYAVVMGDMLDNFVHAWCVSIRKQTTTSIPQEWAAVRYWLGLIAPKLVAVVDGNHDQWTTSLAGIDYFREVVAAARPGALYAQDDMHVSLSVGAATWPMRLRHKWMGSSIYNPTHAQERAQKWDQDFLIGVGAHTHTGAFARSFNAGGREGWAIQVGTYKVEDDYPRRMGFPINNGRKPVILTLYEDGASMATTDIRRAAEMLRLYYEKAA